MKVTLLTYKMAERFIVSRCNLIVGFNNYKSMADVTRVTAQVKIPPELKYESLEYKTYKIGENCVLVTTECKVAKSTSYSFVNMRTGNSLVWETANDLDGDIYFTRFICNNTVKMETRVFRDQQYVTLEYHYINICNICIRNYKAKGASAIMVGKYVRLVPTIPSILCDPTYIVAVINDIFNDTGAKYTFMFIIDQSGVAGNMRLIKLPTIPEMPIEEYYINLSLVGDRANTILVMPIQVGAMRLVDILRPLILAAFNVSE